MVRRGFQIILFAQLLVHIGFAMRANAQQAQDVINEHVRGATDDLSRRMALLEAEKLSSRVAVLEDEAKDAVETKWLVRGGTAALLGQLGLTLRPRRKSEPREETQA